MRVTNAPIIPGVNQKIINQNRVKLMLFAGGTLYTERSPTRVASRVPTPETEIGIVAMVAAIAHMKNIVGYRMCMSNSCAMKYS